MTEQIYTDLACARILLRLYRLLDDGAGDSAIIDLFWPDAMWEREQPTFGHDEMRISLNKRSKTRFVRHLITNIIIDNIAEHQARAVAYLMVYQVDDGGVPQLPLPLPLPLVFGSLIVTFEQRLEIWKIKELKFNREFTRS